MKTTTNRINNTTTNSNRISTTVSKGNDLTNRILQEGNGKGLLTFCRELAVIIINRYSVEDDAARLRGKLRESLTATLRCTENQAQCLIDISLEMIHHKIHGKYRRSDIDLGHLIANASGVVGDVQSN